MPETLRTLQDALPEAIRKNGNFLSAPQEIERALLPVYIFDPENFAILAANAAALRLYGYTEEEFLRLTILDIRPLFNAVKHGAGGKTVRVAVSVDAAEASAEVRIVNPGQLPPGFAGLRQSGNGLQLVGLLLPSQGANLAWLERDGEVTATLLLCQPAIVPHFRPA